MSLGLRSHKVAFWNQSPRDHLVCDDLRAVKYECARAVRVALINNIVPSKINVSGW